MANIAFIDFVDPSHMAAALLMKHAVHFADDRRRQEFPGSPHHDTETILLRGPAVIVSRETFQADVPHEDQHLLEKWPSARRVLDVIAAGHVARTGSPAVLGKAMVVKLRVGGTIDWHVDEGAYAEVHDRFHLALTPAPGARLLSGGDSVTLTPGTLVWLNNRALHSAINMGPTERIHLIVDIRKPQAVN